MKQQPFQKKLSSTQMTSDHKNTNISSTVELVTDHKIDISQLKNML